MEYSIPLPFRREKEKTVKRTIQQIWLPGLNHFVDNGEGGGGGSGEVKPSPPYRPFLMYFTKTDLNNYRSALNA